MKKLLKPFLISFFSMWISAMLLLFVIVLSGCSTTKKVEKMKSDIVLNSDLESKKKTDEMRNIKTNSTGETASSKNTESTENKSKETETKTTKYDTSQPVIPGTGKPPVAEESTTTERETSNRDTKVLEALTTKYNLQVKENKRLKQSNDSLLSVKSKESSKSENKESTSFPLWKYLSIVLGITLLIFVFDKFSLCPKLFVWVLKIFRVGPK
jgi:outer membrane murein-binding lipoprotein Lpp